jgi:predicted nucleic acid-binding protein
MACKLIVKTKKGKISKLFNNLNDRFGENQAKDLYSLADTPTFKTWLSKNSHYKFDKNEEIEFKAVLDFNENFYTEPIKKTREVSKVTQTKINLLKDSFKNVGVTVNVVEDYELDGRAKLDAAVGNEIPTIRFNPSRVFSDTIIHEFGHIYVDLLGYEHPLVQAGIGQLKESSLWIQIKSKYPNLTMEALGKEVLVTAIGKEGAKLFENQNKQNRIQRIFSAIFSAVGKLLGINTNVAKQLASEMLNKNIQNELTGEISTYDQWSKDLDSSVLNEEAIAQTELTHYLNNKVTNLYRQIRKYKSISPEYSDELKDLVKDIQLSDTEVQLEKLNDHISRSLGKIVTLPNGEKRVTGIQGRLIKTEEALKKVRKLDDAIKSKRLNNTFLTDKEIENLRETKKSLLMGAIRNLYHMNVELDSFRDLADLDDTIDYPPQIQEAISKLQDNIGNIEKLYKKTIRASKLAFRLELQEYSSNQEVIDDAMRIFDDNFDESGAQRWMDALADTNHSFIALIRKRVAEEQDRGRRDSLRLKAEWKERMADLKKKGISIDVFFEEVDGVKTGRLIQEYDYSSYYTLRSKVFDEVNELKIKADSLPKGAARSKLLKKAKSIIRDFYVNNMEPVENWEQIVKERREKLSDEKFESWVDSNIYKDSSGNIYPSGELLQIKKSKYKNPKFDVLMKDPNKKEFYDYYQRLINDLTGHSRNEFLRKGWIPAVPLDQRTYLKALKDSIGFKTKKEEQEEFATDEAKEVLVDEKGDVINFVPFYYMAKLNQLDKKKITDDMTAEEKNAILEENRKIDEANRQAHLDALDFNLERTMISFIDTAINHRSKSAMEEQVLLAREVLTHTRIKKKSFKSSIDKIAKQDMGEDRGLDFDASQSNILQHFDDWIKMVFYEDFAADEGAWTKASRVLQNWASLRGIGWNIFSGINNKVYGMYQMNVESAGGQFFGYKHYRQASGEYYSHFHEYLMQGINASIRGEQPSQFATNSLTGGLMVHFDILQSQDELADMAGGPEASKLHRFKFFTDSAYAMQHIGEHTMQNITLLSMLKKYKIDPSNGKIYRNPAAYARKNGLGYSTAEEKASINKKFEELDTVHSAYELVDGYAQLKEGFKITDKEWSEFRQEVIGVNQYLHGIYNKEDAGAMQKFGLARLAIQFRKWARPGWNRRFGTKFGQSFWNERRNMLDEGMYVSTAKFTWKMLKDYRNMFTNAKLNWDSLDETQKANVKRSAMELLLTTSVYVLGQVLRGMEDDDEELADSMMFNVLMYQVDRLWTEQMTYSPMYGWFNEGSKMIQSPTASWNMVEDIFKLSYNTFAYPFRTEDERVFKSGVNYGDSKISTYFRKSIPLYNQLGRIDRLKKNNKFYKLF